MPRYFNTTGPCDARRHYMLGPEERLPDLLPFVEQELYFVLHAARQTGKTTAMRAFAERLRGMGHVGLWTTLEESQGFDRVEDAEPLWLAAIHDAARRSLPTELRPPSTEAALAGAVGSRLRSYLEEWSAALPDRSIVLLLDEADVLRGHPLVSLLRQLRAGFMDRGPGRFPVSIGLIGMRDLRDYLAAAKGGAAVNPGSPFNIKAASITLRNFNRAEVGRLYAQHTADTGQSFLPEAVDRAFDWTAGQPFLVNALARIATMERVTDRSVAITAEAIDGAKEALILSRTTHLDSLAERLREPRVAAIVQSIVVGEGGIVYDTDDFQYVRDTGLVVRGQDGVEIANPIYREVLARQLSLNIQENLPRPRWRWQRPDGGLDMAALVSAFLDWWRENAVILFENADPGYLEALPHLAFMGFLQRVINGGGTVHPEYAAARGRVDLVVSYGGERFVIELKRVPPAHRSLERVRQEGIEQLCGYLDRLGEKQGWLLIFDQRPGRSWDDRIWADNPIIDGRQLFLRGA